MEVLVTETNYRLRTWNIVMGALHALQGVLVHLRAHDDRASKVLGERRCGLAPAVQAFGLIGPAATGHALQIVDDHEV